MTTQHEPSGYWPRDAACSSDACQQGRIECPTKHACWLPECEREMNDWRNAAIDVTVVVFVVMCLAALAAVIF